MLSISKTLPAVTPPVYDAAKRETLAVSAISCADHPQEAPANRNNYLWQYSKPPQLLDGYDKSRSFYGCADWHSAVGSVWTLMSLMKQDPKISVASDIKDISTTHFKKPNMDGELAFFNDQKGPDANFEKPYGYAWLLKLYGEVKGSNSEDDKKLATRSMPLAKWMSERYVFYLYDLKYPYRTGVESNTAWSMSLALDGANLSEDTTLKTAIHANAIRLFEKDKNCSTNFEPQNTDLVSSCLTEAALMGRVMDQQSVSQVARCVSSACLFGCVSGLCEGCRRQPHQHDGTGCTDSAGRGVAFDRFELSACRGSRQHYICAAEG